MTTIEKLARAMVVARHLDPDECVSGSGFATADGLGGVSCHIRWWQWYRSDVRAVLTALLEPSEGMVEAAINQTIMIRPDDTEVRAVFRAAIQAALDEK